MADEHDDAAPGSEAAPSGGVHDQIGAALDRIEADLDEVASAIARMA